MMAPARFSRRMFSSTNTNKEMDVSSMADTDSNTSYNSSASELHAGEEEMRLRLSGEQEVVSLYREIRRGAYKNVKTIHFCLRPRNGERVSKMARLSDVMSALGSLPHLEHVVFTDAVLFLPAVNKLLKQAWLRTLKFHHCKFILGNKNDSRSSSNANGGLDKLWNRIAFSTKLETLEILGCTSVPYERNDYRSSQTLSDDSVSFMLPLFLQEQPSCLPALRRLVLDECLLDSRGDAFSNLLEANTKLEELELRPAFEESANVARRHQYETKKKALRLFLTETIPETLANNSSLKKLVIHLEDYHLERVCEAAMTSWMELMAYENGVLTDLRATSTPFCSVESWTSLGEEQDDFGNELVMLSPPSRSAEDSSSVVESTIGFHIQRKRNTDPASVWC